MKSSRSASVSNESIVAALGSIPLATDEVESFRGALTKPQPSVLRVRDVECDVPFETEPIDWYRLGRRPTDATIRPSRFLHYATGDYFLQDAGSLLALAACESDQGLSVSDQNVGPLVCDLCAAPGGKASALLESLGDRGFLLANEPIRSRIAPLTYNLARTGSDRFAVTSMDPDELSDRLTGVFDLVLVDAPCSGQALLSRGRQTASALSKKQIMHSAARQRRILLAAIRMLRSGGRLIYSTCTFTEEENEQQIEFLVKENLAKPHQIDALSTYQSTSNAVGDSSACYRLWPHRHQCAGSFAASMEVLEQESPDARKRSWKRRKGSKLPTDTSDWFEIEHDAIRLKTLESVVFAWPSDAPDWIDELAIGGPEILHRTGQTWKPSHAAALRRVDRAARLQSIEVTSEAAKVFLSGQPIVCEQPGWHVVRYQQKPLGWIKASSQVGKNQLPTAARLMGPWSC